MNERKFPAISECKIILIYSAFRRGGDRRQIQAENRWYDCAGGSLNPAKSSAHTSGGQSVHSDLTKTVTSSKQPSKNKTTL